MASTYDLCQSLSWASNLLFMANTVCNYLTSQYIWFQSEDVKASSNMEKKGLIKGLEFLQSSGITVKSLTTDRHSGIKKHMREKEAEILHYFDVWHVAKGTVICWWYYAILNWPLFTVSLLESFLASRGHKNRLQICLIEKHCFVLIRMTLLLI